MRTTTAWRSTICGSPEGGVLVVKAGWRGTRPYRDGWRAEGTGLQAFTLSAGAHDVDLVVERGPVRMFGVIFEKDGPGVIYNRSGLNGGKCRSWSVVSRKLSGPLSSSNEQPDLVVVNYGTNESLYADYIEKYYPGELREVIRRIKTAVPQSIHAGDEPHGSWRTRRERPDCHAAHAASPCRDPAQIAAETGCAFFNTFQAMGGEGTMARWYESQPRLVSAILCTRCLRRKKSGRAAGIRRWKRASGSLKRERSISPIGVPVRSSKQ